MIKVNLEGYFTYIDIFGEKKKFAQYEPRLNLRGWWVGDRDGMVLETPCGEKTSKYLKFYFLKNGNGAASG